MKRYQQGWRSTLAVSNEASKLKLARAWESLDRSKSLQNCERTSSQRLFFDGNMTGLGRI